MKKQVIFLLLIKKILNSLEQLKIIKKLKKKIKDLILVEWVLTRQHPS